MQLHELNASTEIFTRRLSGEHFFIPFRDVPRRHFDAIRDSLTIADHEIALMGKVEPYCPLVEPRFEDFVQKTGSDVCSYVLPLSHVLYFPVSHATEYFDDSGFKRIHRINTPLHTIKVADPITGFFKTSPPNDSNKFGYTLGIILCAPAHPQLEGLIISPPIVDFNIFSEPGIFPYGDVLRIHEMGEIGAILARKSFFTSDEFETLKNQILTRVKV